MDALLKILQRSARTPHNEIADRLGLSREEVDERVAKLEADGVIIGYQALVDHEKLGRDLVTAVIEVQVRPERGGGFDRIARRIARFDQVSSCYLMSGGYDLLVIVEEESLREVSRFVAERLATMEGVLSTATRFHLKSYKHSGFLIDDEEQGDRLAVAP